MKKFLHQWTGATAAVTDPKVYRESSLAGPTGFRALAPVPTVLNVDDATFSGRISKNGLVGTGLKTIRCWQKNANDRETKLASQLVLASAESLRFLCSVTVSMSTFSSHMLNVVSI